MLKLQSKSQPSLASVNSRAPSSSPCSAADFLDPGLELLPQSHQTSEPFNRLPDQGARRISGKISHKAYLFCTHLSYAVDIQIGHMHFLYNELFTTNALTKTEAQCGLDVGKFFTLRAESPQEASSAFTAVAADAPLLRGPSSRWACTCVC